MKPAIFLDRDGVLNEVLIQGDRPLSPRHFEGFQLYPGLSPPLHRLKKAGYLLMVVTNQPEIARNLLSHVELKKMHDHLCRELPIDEIRTCPHDDGDFCPCRKPKPGMLIDLAQKWGVDLKISFMIGDTWKDMEAGRRAGCRTCLIEQEYNQKVLSDLRAKDIFAAVDKILCP